MKKVIGSCLCNEVTFECNDTFEFFHLCHCHQCQKTSGSAHGANYFSRPENITWLSGERNVARFDVPQRAITNAFCQQCGSALPYVSKTGKYLVVPAGSLDVTPSCPLKRHIFWQEKASWYNDVAHAPKCDSF